MENSVIDTQADLQSANDILIEQVNDQISLGTFDFCDQQLMRGLIDGLGDPRGLVRLRFAETIGEIGEPATTYLIEALLHHENVVLRRAAAKTLTIISDPKAVPTLIYAFLNDPDMVVRSSSAGALARTGEASVTALLEILASSEHPQETKGHAAWALAFIGAEASEHLYKALNSDCLDVRCAVIGAIGHVAQEQGDDKSCNTLITALTDPEPTIRTEAAVGLGLVDYPAAIAHLILALQDTDLDVRKAAINSLGKVGNYTVVKALEPLLHDEQEVIRILAKLAIAQINGQ